MRRAQQYPGNIKLSELSFNPRHLARQCRMAHPRFGQRPHVQPELGTLREEMKTDSVVSSWILIVELLHARLRDVLPKRWQVASLQAATGGRYTHSHSPLAVLSLLALTPNSK